MRSILLSGVAIVALAVAGVAARADEMADAKARMATATQKAGKWDGPTTGPTAAKGKTIIYVGGRHPQRRYRGCVARRRGGRQGDRLDAAHHRRPRRDFRPHRGAEPGDRAEARRHHRRRLRRDRAECRARRREDRPAFPSSAGTPRSRRGPTPRPACSPTSTPASRTWPIRPPTMAIVESGGKAGVVIFGDSNYEMAIGKARMMEAAIKKCGGCTVLSLEDSPDDGSLDPHAAAHHLAAAALRRQVDLFARRERPLLRLHGAVACRGRQGRHRHAEEHLGGRRLGIGLPAHPHASSTRSRPCRSRCTSRAGSSSTNSTAPSPSSHGRATSASIHLVTADNIAFDGGPKNVFDPDNGYRDAYKKIWGVK